MGSNSINKNSTGVSWTPVVFYRPPVLGKICKILPKCLYLCHGVESGNNAQDAEGGTIVNRRLCRDGLLYQYSGEKPGLRGPKD